MADAEGLLARWSRRKRDAAAHGEREPGGEPAGGNGRDPHGGTAASGGDELALPPLDGLGADSDYGAFLAPDVPGDLHRLALRKAWTSNPTILGFRGLCEYDWDCNASGYGQLLGTDDVLRLCQSILGPPVPESSGTETLAPSDEPQAHPAPSTIPTAELGASRDTAHATVPVTG